MRDDTNNSEVRNVNVVFRRDFKDGTLSERERECLRAFLPGLIMELVQTGLQDHDEE